MGVAVDAAGDVFIADTSNNRVVKVPAGEGAQTTVGTGLRSPQGVAVDAAPATAPTPTTAPTTTVPPTT